MRYRKGMVCIFTAIFLALAILIGAMDAPPPPGEESSLPALELTLRDGAQLLPCWERESGDYYFFLPGCADLSQAVFRLEASRQFSLDGQALFDGMSCADFCPDTPYPLTSPEGAAGSLTFLRSENVPAMYIDVRSGNMDYIHGKKGNAEPGSLRIYLPDGTLSHSGSLEAINGRGNVTWENCDKKPYSLKLTAEADLLGLGTAKKWILMANGYDDSNLRNKAVYDFAREIGLAYAPDCTWVDLYLNGEYAGLYLLTERNEIHPQRVAIAETGSTLVSIDMEQRLARQGYPHIMVDGDTALRLHSGVKVTDEMTDFWKSVDNAIQAQDGIDPVTGKHYLDFIDLDSWVRKYLIEEVFANVEASAVSHYFYIDGSDETGKIYAGPVWDYDYALGSTRTWQTGTVEALFCARPYVWDETDTPWFYALWQKEEFRQQVIALYEAEFRPKLQQLLETGLDRYAAGMDTAARMNQIRWHRFLSPAQQETQAIRDYLSARLAFLDQLWLEGKPYHTVTANMTNGSVVSCYAIAPGGRLPEMPDLSWETDAIGWYDYDTGEAFDITQPIYENKRIYLKREESPMAPEGTLQKLIRYAPAAGLLAIGLILCLLDGIRRKRTEIQNHERTKANQISS